MFFHDNTPPDSLDMQFVFGDWTRYNQGSWTNQAVYAANTSSNPGPTANDPHSGIAKYQISSNGSTWVDYNYVYFNGSYYRIMMIDYNGNMKMLEIIPNSFEKLDVQEEKVM